MDKIVERYYQLKREQKGIEQELSELRGVILEHCQALESTEFEVDGYRVRMVRQERREYDETKLYQALPDPEVWRLLSKPDAGKIAGMIKLNVITEESVKHTYAIKPITVLQVDKV